MKFFIDTANIDEIKKGVEMGMVDGVTTNPSLVAKESKPFEEIVAEICQIVDGPVTRRQPALSCSSWSSSSTLLPSSPEPGSANGSGGEDREDAHDRFRRRFRAARTGTVRFCEHER
mgnify:CR=1 FL=1